MLTDVDAPSERARGLRIALAFGVVLGLAFMLSEYSGPSESKPRWQTLLESVAFLPLQLASALGLALASRRRELAAATQRGLRWLAASFGAISVGSIVYFGRELAGRPLSYTSSADAIYFLCYPAIVVGLSALPASPRPRDAVRDTVGLLVVALAFGSLVVLAAKADAVNPDSTMLARWIVMASSAAQLVTLISVNRAIEAARRLPSTRALLLLLVGLTMSVGGDLIYQLLHSYGYTGANWSVAVAIVTNWLVLLSAIRFLEDPVAVGPDAGAPRVLFSPVPILAVIAVAMLVVWLSGRGFLPELGVTLAGLSVLSALLVARDLLASRAAAESMQVGAQREAERRLEALVQHANDAILLLDDHGRVVYASAPTATLLGAAPAALEGRSLEALMPTSEHEAWRDFLARVRSAGHLPATHQWQFARTDGTKRLIETVGRDLRDEPAVRGLVLNSRDVTERTTLEERLRQAQKLEVAGRLASGVAHDFNNVLTAVVAGTELARLSLDADHPAQADLTSVEAGAARGVALTRRLLAFVRHEPVPAQRVDPGEMLRDLAPLLQRLAGETVEVRIRVGPGLGSVHTDHAELEHILFNLVANARDAMPAGGPVRVEADAVTVTAATDPGPFIIMPPPGRYAAIAVVDGGTGMSDDVRRRMFDPFFTMKTGGRGTGLGLIGVRPLVEAARGGLRVQSSPDSGTTITLYLPTSTVEPGSDAPSAVAQRLPNRPRRSDPAHRAADIGARTGVLLIEDEADVREQLARLLEAHGFGVIPAASTADARLVLANRRAEVHAIVSDVIMPGETGIDFSEWMRATHPDLPILLISGHTGTAPDREARSLGGLPLLRKPFSGAELTERIQQLLAPH